MTDRRSQKMALTKEEECPVRLAGPQHVQGHEDEGLDGGNGEVAAEMHQGMVASVLEVRSSEILLICLIPDGEDEKIHHAGHIACSVRLSRPYGDVVLQSRVREEIHEPAGDGEVCPYCTRDGIVVEGRRG